MTRDPRRHAILLAGAAAVLPALLAAAPARPAAAQQSPFVAPEATLILTRTLRRDLVDGKEVVTRRRYEVRIVPDDHGFRVDGRLLDATVEAPPELAALTAIERARPDAALFPMQLDSSGLIVPAMLPVPDGAARTVAGAEAAAVIARSSLPDSEKALARTFIDQLGRSRSGVNPVPQDLFRPGEGRRVERRTLDLPGGQVGEMTIEIEANAAGDAGLLESLEQTVVTELGGTRRTNRERWTLELSR